MKKKISTLSLIALFGLGLSLSSCDAGVQTTTVVDMKADSIQTTTPQPKPATELTSDKKTEILNAYLLVKDALVATDGKAAGSAASALVMTIGDADGELVKKIRFDAEHISETEDTGHQRDHFGSLSDNVFALVKGSGVGKKLYRQHCPMAFDGKGANWISSESEIMNPYFGDKMLHCGKVEEEI
jgi:hypothetical protein